MTYSPATGSYQADFLEGILNTNYKYGVPYKIDREKYESAMKAFNKEIRIKDADVVIFHADYNKDENNDRNIYSYAFYAWPKNSPKGSNDFYDCSQFWDYEYDYKHKEKFEEFVFEVLKSIVGVDQEYLKNKIKEQEEECEIITKNIEILTNLLF